MPNRRRLAATLSLLAGLALIGGAFVVPASATATGPPSEVRGGSGNPTDDNPTGGNPNPGSIKITVEGVERPGNNPQVCGAFRVVGTNLLPDSDLQLVVNPQGGGEAAGTGSYSGPVSTDGTGSFTSGDITLADGLYKAEVTYDEVDEADQGPRGKSVNVTVTCDEPGEDPGEDPGENGPIDEIVETTPQDDSVGDISTEIAPETGAGSAEVSDAQASPTLPRTGLSTLPLGMVAAGLLSGGFGFTQLGRRDGA